MEGESRGAGGGQDGAADRTLVPLSRAMPSEGWTRKLPGTRPPARGGGRLWIEPRRDPGTLRAPAARRLKRREGGQVHVLPATKQAAGACGSSPTCLQEIGDSGGTQEVPVSHVQHPLPYTEPLCAAWGGD